MAVVVVEEVGEILSFVELAERPEVKLTKGSSKRERFEDKMIEYIDLTKKAEVDIRKDDFISLQVEAMAESIRESLGKRQAYACLHEMQGVVFWYVSAKLDRQAGQITHPMAAQQIGNQMAVPPLQQQQDNQLETGFRSLLYADL